MNYKSDENQKHAFERKLKKMKFVQSLLNFEEIEGQNKNHHHD